ncbi:MAG: chemotaxis protein CheA, partial [Desulfobulbaceae bacterium]|nr:chemotaxis protein CheA [Desulfobulbaceae bacterium]
MDETDIFKTEAIELLDELEEALLKLEEDSENMDLVNRIFRALHTIKGSGAMFGFEDVSDFTHNIETTYDAVRSGESLVSPDLVSLTLAACDIIRLMVNGEQVGGEKRDSLIAQFKAIDKKDQQLPASAEQDGQVTKGSTSGSAAIYRINFRPKPEIFQSVVDFIPLFDELRALGEGTVICHTSSVPGLQGLKAETCYLSWEIILTTNQGENAIRDVFIFVEDDCDLDIITLEHDVTIDDIAPAPLLGEILVAKGDVSPEQLAESIARKTLIGEQLINDRLVVQSNIKSALAEQEQVKKLRTEQQEAVGANSVRVPADKLDSLVDLVGELVIVQARLSQHTSSLDPVSISIAEEVERLTTELRDNAMSLRMQPVGNLFGKFKRLIRDLSKDLDKEIDLILEGGETELDKTVVEQLNNPLVHIIRNCVDHGIETPEVRAAHGKSKTGTIRLTAEHAGANVEICISDDGAGLDVEAIRAKAIERGIATEGAVFTDQEIFSLIFEPGFSTAGKVSDVSGRGVGMDVVKRGVQALRGVVEVNSRPGKGTTITIKLPLTLAIIDGLLVETAEEMFVIPQAVVIECYEQTLSDIANSHGNNVIRVMDKMVPYVCLRQRFGLDGEIPPSRRVIMCETNGKKIGLAVDRVIGSYQTVIKPLGDIYKG